MPANPSRPVKPSYRKHPARISDSDPSLEPNNSNTDNNIGQLSPSTASIEEQPAELPFLNIPAPAPTPASAPASSTNRSERGQKARSSRKADSSESPSLPKIRATKPTINARENNEEEDSLDDVLPFAHTSPLYVPEKKMKQEEAAPLSAKLAKLKGTLHSATNSFSGKPNQNKASLPSQHASNNNGGRDCRNRKWNFFSCPFSKPIVGVLHLNGIIAARSSMRRGEGLNLKKVEKEIEEVFSLHKKKQKAVAIVINSPGGSPVQTELIFRRIRSLSKEKNIPVLTFVEDIAASGGYWLACAGDEIFVLESSLIGSIGVIAGGFGFVKAINKIGIERRVYTEGENKNILDPFLPEKESDVALLKRAMHDLHDVFKANVKERRGNKIEKSDPNTLFSGAFWSGREAISLGLADAQGDLHTVLHERYGKKVRIITVERKQGWFERRFGGMAQSLVSALIDTLENRLEWKFRQPLD